MKNHYYIKQILLLTLCLFWVAAPAQAASQRVAILPFDMYAEKDLTFLQDGIQDMLASRLAWPDKVVVIDKNETRAAVGSVLDGFEGESRALLVGGKLNADYVLFGSITVFGESVSIDAKMVDVTGQQPPLPFYTQTQGLNRVIPEINRFATSINETVFGRAAPKRPAATAPASRPAGQSPEQKAHYNQRMHPEKLLKDLP